MEKRTLLAIVLSVVILSVYSAFVSRMYPVANKGDAIKTAIVAPPEDLPLAIQPLVQAQPPVREYTEAETDKFKIVFVNPGAYINRVELKEYGAQLFLEGLLLVSDEQNYAFRAEKTPEGITFTYRDNSREIIKRYSLSNNSYNIELERTIRYFNAEAPASNYRLWLNTGLIKQSSQDNRFMELAVAQPGKKLARKNLLGLRSGPVHNGGLDWVGMRDRYFAFVLHPESKISGVSAQQVGEQAQVGIDVASQGRDKFTLYLGPQYVEYLSAANLGFENMLPSGFLETIGQILLSALKLLFKITHNWGGAILLFSFLIFLVMYPLTLKQMRSMKEMQILQPKIKELQERLKGDSQKLNKEIMQLYKEHGVNPLGGCLPLLLQFPIFIALYQTLMRFVGLRGTSFLWIKDLSQPDQLITLANKLPIIGNEINLLPILMMFSMFIQQKVSMAAMSGTSSAEQQKMMAVLMPLLFGIMFYSMPAALVLYWFTYGVLSGAQQWLLTRPKPVA